MAFSSVWENVKFEQAMELVTIKLSLNDGRKEERNDRRKEYVQVMAMMDRI